ncbi:MAG: hypothetical protein RRZ65_05445 [Tannerellaceae bacterium]
MSETNKKQLIIVLAHHLNLGPLLIPYYAKRISEEVVQVEEQAGVSSRAVSLLTEAEQKVVIIAESYSDKNLMLAYSKEKSVTDFMRKLSEATLKETIRPFIEKKLLEMIQLIHAHGLPIYEKDPGKKLLYDHSRYNIPAEYTEPDFLFEVTDEYFRYSVECSRAGELVPLMNKKPVVVLTARPANIFVARDLLMFEHINSARLLPFMTKRFVTVDSANTQKYMEKVVLPTVQSYPAKAVGFDMDEIEETCHAELSIESPYSAQLRFRYGEHTFSAGQPAALKYPHLEKTKEGKYLVRYFTRQTASEQQCVNLLEKAGLERTSGDQFVFADGKTKYSQADWEELWKLPETNSALQLFIQKATAKKRQTQ